MPRSWLTSFVVALILGISFSYTFAQRSRSRSTTRENVKKMWETSLPEGNVQEYARIYSNGNGIRIYSKDKGLPANYKPSSILFENLKHDGQMFNLLAIRVDIDGRRNQACLIGANLGAPLPGVKRAVNRMSASGNPVPQGQMKTLYVSTKPLATDLPTLEQMYGNSTRVYKHCDNPIKERGVFELKNVPSGPVSTESYTVSGMIDSMQPLKSVPVKIVLESGLSFSGAEAGAEGGAATAEPTEAP
uniref:Larval shell matrix protein 1 n=1 Tax=Pinctada fucata TaxID=50426 RepID=A0A3G2LJ51_PINFU|nr:larval shell matrix protein 1 [Pinctada fucata]